MPLEVVTGVIDHRILLNYRLDPAVVAKILPSPLKPKLVNGWSIGGICQVSLSRMRPRGLPAVAGVHSHNAAHRIAVVQDSGEGVYIPRRDTGSRINQIAGGRLFPGVYKHSQFVVRAEGDEYSVEITSDSGRRIMAIHARVSDRVSRDSVFCTLAEASAFFQAGDTGWSPSKVPGKLDTIELWTQDWRMEGLEVASQCSSYFSDTSIFPEGSVAFDSGFIMRGLEHEWRAHEGLARIRS
jgi:hypothetical protein